MAGAITTGNFPKALWPGVKAWFGTAYDAHDDEFPDLFEQDTSDQNYEEDVQDRGFGLAPIKTQGQSIAYDSTSQGYVSRYTHVAYATGFIVTWEEFQDNKYEKIALRGTRDLAFSFRQTKENVSANVYNRAFNSSYTGGDASALCVNNHSTITGSQSNLGTAAADLSEASLEDMCVTIMNATNERGLKISLMPRSLIIPTALAFEATRILKSSGQNDTANNAINALRSMGVFPDGAKVNHYLTDNDAWFVRTNAPNGLKYFSREAAEFTQDNDFDTSNLKYKGYERYSCRLDRLARRVRLGRRVSTAGRSSGRPVFSRTLKPSTRTPRGFRGESHAEFQFPRRLCFRNYHPQPSAAVRLSGQGVLGIFDHRIGRQQGHVRPPLRHDRLRHRPVHGQQGRHHHGEARPYRDGLGCQRHCR
jgi:hypothetical protein